MLHFALVRVHNLRVTEHPPQPAEGALIKRAARVAGMSTRQLAAKAGISDTRWRQLVNGYVPLGGGRFTPAVAPAATLAQMARAVGVTSDQLRTAGRADAADELDAMNQLGASQTDGNDEGELLIHAALVSDAAKVRMLDRYRSKRQQMLRELRDDLAWERERHGDTG